MSRAGHGDLLNRVESRFPRAAAAIREEIRVFDRSEAVSAFDRALELYGDDLCAEPDLHEFFDIPRHHYRTSAISMLERSSVFFFEGGRLERSRECAVRLIDLEPGHEGAHRQLMRLYAALGQRDLVREQFELCRSLVRKDLDCEPSEETRALYGELVPA